LSHVSIVHSLAARPHIASRTALSTGRQGRTTTMKSARLVSLLFATSVFAVGSTWALEGARQIPAREIAVPETTSPQLQALIAAPFSPIWNTHPKSAQEWKALVQTLAEQTLKGLPALREKMTVTFEPGVIAGVKVFTVMPSEVSAVNRNRLLLHVHGGGYVLGPGEAGLPEAILMAAHGHIKVISVDYRMPPDFPYPAAMDDAMAVYKEVLKTTDAKHIGIFGTSTGGGMTLAMVLRAKAEGQPIPAAIAPGTPWSDMTKTGDSYFTNDMIDNVLVSNDGWLGEAAKVYANGHDLKDPMLSPVYGDLRGFPPTILTTGTRDLFLSNTVRVHQKLREAGVVADLIVFEGMSHAQYLRDPDAPESEEHFTQVTAFFERFLEK
jgi:epsilon-lactone hydrolase